MKIGIDIRPLMDAQYSGVSEYTLNLVKEILKLDASASSARANNQYKLFYNSFHDIKSRLPEFKSANVEVIGLNYPNKILNYLYFKLLAYPKIDKLLDVDLFFMPHLNFIALSPYCKSIITIHDLSFFRFREYFSLKKNLWHYLLNVKNLLNKFDLIIAQSANTKQDIMELCGVKEEKIKVIYSGVGQEFKKLQFSIFDFQKNIASLYLNNDYKKLNEVRKKYDLPEKFILYLGTLEPRKNIEGIIGAYGELRRKNKELDNIKLVIAGGWGWKSKNILKVWRKSNYKDEIEFLGYVESADKVYLYNLASVFVYPSFYEGFGFPPLEAMACGLPVITSFSSSLPEVVSEAAIMVDPDNINQIAEALKQILTDYELRNDLIKKGLERARQFSWEKTAREYLEVFQDV